MLCVRRHVFRIYRSSIIVPQCKLNNTSKSANNALDINKIRNIGILAHIDAGKTTTTERMLYYAGLIQEMGEVHDGNTVTDYMDQERERGITITSAAITFNWKKNQFNLIDTPGHIDFTMEVEQTLNVLDGAVVILDGSAGVEAQTITVWRQAERYDIPKIVYVNKMDRSDSDIHMCCESIEKKLEVPYVLLQLPVRENGKLIGVIDVLSMEFMNFGSGREKSVTNESLINNSKLETYLNTASKHRYKIIEKLTDFDDELADKVITSESFDNISSADIVRILRKCTMNKQIVPVFLGSSYKNIGVQSLMDAVILYLPSPLDTSREFATSFDQNLCARAFKVIHDKQKGPLVFMRVYNGSLKRNQKIYSIQHDVSEQVNRLYVAYADDFKEVETVESGNIAVGSGLKKTMSGDLVTNSQSSAEKAKKNMLKLCGKTEEDINDSDNIFGFGAKVPEPVFFCSIEPPSLAFQAPLEHALVELQREDPSLRVTYNEETGQTVLAGMGELHLDIIRDRILKEYKIEADLGPLQIAYRESPVTKVTDTLKLETKIGNSTQSVTVTLSILPNETSVESKDILKFDKSPENASMIAAIYPKHMQAVRQGVIVGLANGPKISSPVINCNIMLHFLQVGRGTATTIISAAVTQAIQKLLRTSETWILEPIMHLEIVCPEEHLSGVLSDLTRRRGIMHSVSMRGKSKIAVVETPLSELMGYSTYLRTLTSGTSSFTMEFSHYERMSSQDEANAIKSVRGF